MQSKFVFYVVFVLTVFAASTRLKYVSEVSKLDDTVCYDNLELDIITLSGTYESRCSFGDGGPSCPVKFVPYTLIGTITITFCARARCVCV